MKLMQQIGKFDYFYRHAFNFLPYVTPKKVFNIALNYAEFKLKVTRPRSFPPYIKIEPTPLCHLKCPGCAHSRPGFSDEYSKSTKISMEDFKKAIDPLADHLLGISLSNHGEPMLHPNIHELAEYCHSKRIAVSFPSNLSIKRNNDAWERLLKSGVDSMYVSLDGASEQTYSRYRVGGNFNLVVSNVKTMAEIKKRLGLKRPRLVWKFVVFEHNQHEVSIVKSTYREKGFDAFEFVPDNTTAKHQAERNDIRKNIIESGVGCFWLWHTMMIDWNGEVAPCCTHEKFNLGNAIQTNSADVWRSDAYIALRTGFVDQEKMNPKCKTCMGVTPATTKYPIVSMEQVH